MQGDGGKCRRWRKAHEPALIKEASAEWLLSHAPDRGDGDCGERGIDDFEEDKRTEVHVVSFPSFEAFAVSART